MKIVVITSWFSEKMGYSENFFPKALASLGHDVHVVTSTAQVYYKSPTYGKTYFKHLGPAIVEPGVKKVDGFTLHRLNFSEDNTNPLSPFRLRGIRIAKLKEYLNSLHPDIVQVVNSIDEPSTYDAALYARENNTMIFTESHLHASVMKANKKRIVLEVLRSFLYKFHPNITLINNVTTLCYPIAPDAAEIVRAFFHVPNNKIKIQPLGVDTELFCPALTNELRENREKLRGSLGFNENDLVCIYTGRFSHSKNPQLLAEAINQLQQQGENVKGLFLGNGTDEEVKQISSKRGCTVHPFVYVRDLPNYYRCADLAVWPREESTSQLDAAACGLPVILSNKISVTERVEGNGFLYEEGNASDLAEKILLLKSSKLRNQFSKVGVEKVFREFSWLTLAAQRIEDYKNFLTKT